MSDAEKIVSEPKKSKKSKESKAVQDPTMEELVAERIPVEIEVTADLAGNMDTDFNTIISLFDNVGDDVDRVVVRLTAKNESAYPEVFIQEVQLRERIQKHLTDAGMLWAMGKDVTEGHFNIRITRAGLERQVLRADYKGEYPFNKIGVAELAGVFKEKPSNL